MDDDHHDKVVKRVVAGLLAAVLAALFWVPEISEWVMEMWFKLDEVWERVASRVWRSGSAAAGA